MTGPSATPSRWLLSTASALAVAAPVLLGGCGRPAGETKPKTEAPAPAQAPRTSLRVSAKGQLGPGRGTLVLDLAPPKGAHLTPGTPLRLRGRGQDLAFPEPLEGDLDLSKLPIRFPIVVADGALGPAELDLTFYYCTDGDDGACRPERVALVVDLDTSGSGEGGEAHVSHTPIL